MNIYAEKNKYVESLNKSLSVLQDFDAVCYAWDALTGSEYVKISDTLGGYSCIEVTGDGLETIFKNVVKTLLAGDKDLPLRIVFDRERLREIAPLFKKPDRSLTEEEIDSMLARALTAQTDCSWK